MAGLDVELYRTAWRKSTEYAGFRFCKCGRDEYLRGRTYDRQLCLTCFATRASKKIRRRRVRA